MEELVREASGGMAGNLRPARGSAPRPGRVHLGATRAGIAGAQTQSGDSVASIGDCSRRLAPGCWRSGIFHCAGQSGKENPDKTHEPTPWHAALEGKLPTGSQRRKGGSRNPVLSRSRCARVAPQIGAKIAWFGLFKRLGHNWPAWWPHCKHTHRNAKIPTFSAAL